MAKTETLHIRVNESVKENAEETLAVLGITLSEAVNMFLCQVNLTGGIPFEVKLPAPESVIIRSEEDLWKKLQEVEEDVQTGKTYTAEEVFGRLRDKYGL